MPLLSLEPSPFPAFLYLLNLNRPSLSGFLLRFFSFFLGDFLPEPGLVRSPKLDNVFKLCTADFGSYRSAVQKPKHCLTWDFSLPLLRTVVFLFLLLLTFVDPVGVGHVPRVSLGRDADLLEDAGLLQPVDAHLDHMELCDVL